MSKQTSNLNTDRDRKNQLEEILSESWTKVLGIEKIGKDDNFFELGGNSLQAIQVAVTLATALQVEIPKNILFEKQTLASLADAIETLSKTGSELQPTSTEPVSSEIEEPIPFLGSQVASDPSKTAAEIKEKIKELYDLYTRKLNATIYNNSSKFLNYGYIDDGSPQEAVIKLPKYLLHKHNIKLILELIGDCPLTNCRILDISCGRGGNVEVIAKYFDTQEIIGLDLSPEAIAFCQVNYSYDNVRFVVGDSENLPFEANQFDAITNIESSHSYGDVIAFYKEVHRVLKPGGYFLYSDLILAERLEHNLSVLEEIGFIVKRNRDITKQVLLSCEEAAKVNLQVIEVDKDSQVMKEFLAVPGTKFNESFQERIWTYRILRLQKS